MKNVILLALFAFLALPAAGQRVIDTLDVTGAVTVYSDPMTAPEAIQVLCTQTAGTSDGTIRFQASLDGTSWVDVTSDPQVASFYPNDTITIVNGLVALAKIHNKAFPYWRIKGVGTTGDGTDLTIKYSK